MEVGSPLHRRQEARYRALLETAADITSESEPEQQLRRIVLRAQELVEADVVYLWLADPPNGSAYLGATAGGLSAELATLRVPLGRGITGRVIETGLPISTADYFTEPTFSRDNAIDAVMRREGIVAAVGVPLIAGSRRLGALIAANRDHRTYSSSDVALLGSLAAHAACAMDRAQLLAEATHSLLELKETNRKLLEVYEESERAAAAHLSLANVVLAGGGLGGVVDAVVGILGGELVVLDPMRRLLAGPSSFDLYDSAFDEAISRAAESRASDIISADAAAIPVLASNRLLATMVYRSDGSLSAVDIRILERAAIAAALLLLFSESEAGAAQAARDEFFEDLAGGLLTNDRLVHEGARLQFDLTRPFTAHAVSADVSRLRLLSLVQNQAKNSGGIAGRCTPNTKALRGPVIVALLPGNEAQSNSRALAASLQKSVTADIVVSGAGPALTPSAARDLVEEAERCLVAMRRLGHKSMAGTMTELGFIGLVLGSDQDTDEFIGRALGPILGHDAAHNGDLLSTLSAVIDSSNSPTLAARVLHVHVNTVKQRIDRITDLLGEGWRKPARAAELRVALQLRQALRDVRFT